MNVVVLKKINLLLSFTLFFLAIYILLSPYFPYISLFLSQNMDMTKGFKYQSSLAKKQGVNESDLQPIPEENTLVIPKINVDGKIYESESSKILEKGIWHRPKTSTPDKGGNTVIVAHRFLYTSGQSTFYHLDKLKEGDIFTIFWNQEEYNYKVYEVEIVPPNAIEIEENTEEPIVTLYTCTPLWTSTDRLVVKAKLL
jgi:sortase A